MVSVQRESNAVTKYLQKALLSEHSQQPYLPQQTMSIQKTAVLQPPSGSSPGMQQVSLLSVGPAFPARVGGWQGSLVPTSPWSSISSSTHAGGLPKATSRFCSTDPDAPPSSVTLPRVLNLVLPVSSALSRCPILAKLELPWAPWGCPRHVNQEASRLSPAPSL